MIFSSSPSAKRISVKLGAREIILAGLFEEFTEFDL
jgi:hypothetical protein